MTYDHVLYQTIYCIPFGITCVYLCFLEGFVLLCVVFYRSLFVLLDLFYGSLYRLSFFHLSLLITTLVSSNFSSYHTRGQHANEYIINDTTKTCYRHHQIQYPDTIRLWSMVKCFTFTSQINSFQNKTCSILNNNELLISMPRCVVMEQAIVQMNRDMATKLDIYAFITKNLICLFKTLR